MLAMFMRDYHRRSSILSNYTVERRFPGDGFTEIGPNRKRRRRLE
jgi:hypothetical protein